MLTRKLLFTTDGLEFMFLSDYFKVALSTADHKTDSSTTTHFKTSQEE